MCLTQPAGATPVTSAAAIAGTLRAAGCVFAEDEAALLIAEAATPDQLASMVELRVAGFPLEQVLGWTEFCGLRILMEPGVFVPRRRTQFLVQQAVAVGRSARVVVDMCCGSGAVGAAMAAELPAVELYAVDIDPAAVHCAERNLSAIGGRVLEGDLFGPLPAVLRGRVDIIVVNAPYVPTGAIELMPPEARLHEPRVALDGGPDGLDVQRRVTAGAASWLGPGGRLLIETSERQAPKTLEAFARNGLTGRVLHSADLDATVVLGEPPVRSSRVSIPPRSGVS